MASATVPPPKVTLLPAAPPRRGLHFDEYVHTHAYAPVNARAAARGEWQSNGLDFSDIKRFSPVSHKLNSARRLDAPMWAFDPSKLRALITRTMELRAGFV